ncbi:hypothetical protein L228DRAFT_247858 [Xylona heveae TC161]|uniref:Uncharacterized protein n=1 Tax=Xylona heveae (strain CBS 132557 / TC161) TaxID=1328760 RepID=A0A165GIC8_XYLHT|nr:hypothetical protein L228DRAFT_247858 [Xylona heveae TC161]KZF22219.1 hypothetical protein L228DRAFT_247858 [Xylona heveae TC161]
MQSQYPPGKDLQEIDKSNSHITVHQEPASPAGARPHDLGFLEKGGRPSPPILTQMHDGLDPAPELPPPAQFDRPSDILFDASLDQLIDEEFGDFESAALPTASTTEDLISIGPETVQPSSGRNNEQHSLQIQPEGKIKTRVLPRSKCDQTLASPHTMPAVAERQMARHDTLIKENEDWGDLMDFEDPLDSNPCSVLTPSRRSEGAISGGRSHGNTPGHSTTLSIPHAHCTAFNAPARNPSSSSSSSSKVVAPTNIPQPSILLPLITSSFNAFQSRFSAPISIQSHSVREKAIYDPAMIEFLRGYILLGVVATRIIAGRKLRWRRDKYLSQGTKIGPAQSGQKGGMKLAGLDRMEDLKEVREIAETVQAWSTQLGILRSILVAAKSKDSNFSLKIPELKSTPSIRTLSEMEGGLSATYCCALCGLKRNERVGGVDVDVEDSFGEWWAEHWGHRTCKNFWEEHKSTLP